MNEALRSRLDDKIAMVKHTQEMQRQAHEYRRQAHEEQAAEVARRGPEIATLIEVTLKGEAERRPDVFEFLPQEQDPGVKTFVMRCKLNSRHRTLVVKAHVLHGLVEWSIAGKPGAQGKQDSLLSVNEGFFALLFDELID